MFNNKKKHVGRPTNEELAINKKMKLIKFSLIVLLLLFLIGTIFIFFNINSLDLSSIMGSSINKRENYVVNGYSSTTGEYYYSKILYTNNLNAYGYTSCKVNKKKNAKCEVIYKSSDMSEIRVYAKKKGNVNVKVYGKNDKGKTVSKTLKYKITDFTPPFCSITEVPNYSVKRGQRIVTAVTCSEKVNYVGYTSNSNGFSKSTEVFIKHDSVNSTNCKFNRNNYYDYGAYVSGSTRLNDKSFMIYINIPSDICPGKIKLQIKDFVFADSNGNKFLYSLDSKSFLIK